MERVLTRDQNGALWLSTIAVTVGLVAWTIFFSIAGIHIRTDLNLNDTQFGLLVGTPILSGSLTRLILSIWTGQNESSRLRMERLSTRD